MNRSQSRRPRLKKIVSSPSRRRDRARDLVYTKESKETVVLDHHACKNSETFELESWRGLWTMTMKTEAHAKAKRFKRFAARRCARSALCLAAAVA